MNNMEASWLITLARLRDYVQSTSLFSMEKATIAEEDDPQTKEEPYKKILESGNDKLYLDSIRRGCSEAWELIEPSHNIRQIDILRRLPTAVGVNERGWYVAVVQDERDDQYLRLYVGQSKNVASRVSDHKRNIQNPDKPSLFYHCARQENRQVFYYLLGRADETVVESKLLQCWMNIGEHFWSIVLQTLRRHDLDYWLEGIAQPIPSSGLNVALPIHQGFEERSVHANNGFPQLYNSDDPEILAFALAASKRGNVEGHNSQRETGYAGIVKAARNSKASQKGILWREADPSLHDPASLKVHFVNCKDPRSMKIDQHPTYTMVTGRYVCRRK